MAPPAQYRVRRGDYLNLRVWSNVSDVVLTPRFRIVYDDGSNDMLGTNPITLVGDRLIANANGSQRATKDGWVVGGSVLLGVINSFPGQVYVDVGLTSGGERLCLCKGYSYDGHLLSLGESGLPGEGPGDLQWETLASDAAPGTGTSTSLGFVNQIRKVHGFAIYYNASADVATRTVIPSIIQPGGALPTGFGGTGTVWVGATLTLTASEEGVYYVYSSVSGAIVSINDNGTITYANPTTAPAPFPFIGASDGDAAAQLLLTVGSGHANDRWSVYVLREDWVTQL